MINLFALIRRRNESQIQAMKKEHRATAKRAKKSLKDINSVLTNGFAIKVYHAHSSGKHGNT